MRRAFGEDPANRPEFCEVVSFGEGGLLVRLLADRTTRTVTVPEPDGLREVLGRGDVCRWRGGGALAALSLPYGLLAIAVGPSAAPDRVELNYGVVRVEDAVAVEMPGDAPGQPSWYLFAVADAETAG
ncbi:hypothetical protein ACOQFB_16790 [Anaeromyxobacter sp. Red801]|uniref:hypothetical protein n=1 Tax=Anaeromyxobacter sp. Red801 TaxID=3411632 RepID=UPI003B9F98B2